MARLKGLVVTTGTTENRTDGGATIDGVVELVSDLHCRGALFAGANSAGMYYHSTGIASHNENNGYVRSFIDFDINGVITLYGLCKVAHSSVSNILEVNRMAVGDSLIKFSNTNGTLGYMGIDSNGVPEFVTPAFASYPILHTNNAGNYVQTRRDIGGTWRWSGYGNYRYCKIATIDTSAVWVDENIMIEFSGRDYPLAVLRIDFGGQATSDPNLVSFTVSTNGAFNFYMYKAATSTWELYVDTAGIWESIQFYRIIGLNEGMVTMNLTSVSSLPSSGLIAASFDSLYGCDLSIATQIIFGTTSTDNVCLSSNDDIFIVNPTASSTTGQACIGVNGKNTWFTSTGNFGIGTSSPSAKLHVVGNIYATAAFESSDERLKDFGDDIVCGTVYATGTADLHGRPGEIVINCNVTPQANSVFAYNATNPNAISQQEFITWKKSEANAPTKKRSDDDEADDDLASATNI